MHTTRIGKSGKDKSEDESFGINQSKAYSIYLLLRYPEIDTVISKFVFIEHCTEKSIIYTRDKLNEYIKDFYLLTKDVENTEYFRENVTALCDYCDFKKYNYCFSYQDAEKRAKELLNEEISLDF